MITQPRFLPANFAMLQDNTQIPQNSTNIKLVSFRVRCIFRDFSQRSEIPNFFPHFLCNFCNVFEIKSDKDRAY